MDNKNSIKKLTFQLYENIKRFQINVDESLAITLALIYVIYVKQENFISSIEPKSKDKIKNYNNAIDWITDDINNDFNASFITQKTSEYIIYNIRQYEMYYKVPRNIIKNAIEELIDEKSPLLQTPNRKTASFTQRIITGIANKLVINGNYIDLAIGTGSLLKDFKGELLGIDINPKMIIIARVYLFFCGKYEKLKNQHWNANITQNDAITDYIPYKNNGKNIILFDPPMGDLRTYPNDIKWQNTDIIEKEKPARLQSEVLFLMSFLLNAKDNDYFIGLFPENILNKNNKEYNSLRKYLIKNSLISIIKVLTNHVLLIGQKKLTKDRYNKIPVLNITSTLNDEQLQFIGKEIAKKKDFNFEQFYKIFPNDYGTVVKDIGIESFNKDWSQIFAYKIYDRDELIKDNQNIMIPVIKSYEEKHIATPKELIEIIKKDEIEIKNNVEKLDIIVQNLSNLETIVKEDKQWFEEDFTEETQSLVFFKNYFNNECVIKNINAPELYKYFKILYFKNRIKFNRNKFVINYDEHIEVSDLQETTLYKKFNPLLDKEICSVINMIPNDTNIKAVFEDICRYWMLNQDEEKTIVNQKTMKSAELKRCLSVLNNLGLLIYNKNKVRYYDEEKSEINLYKSYIPNIKYLDALRFKEMQDVQ